MLVAWHPDLMISDVGMPLENGYDLIGRVRDLSADKGSGTPAIACMGYARTEDRAGAMYAGFDAVISKPLDFDLLVETIAHMITPRPRPHWPIRPLCCPPRGRYSLRPHCSRPRSAASARRPPSTFADALF